MTYADVIIVGGGPAGLTAAIYCARSGKNTLVFESGAYGGQAVLSEKIENYPGFPNGISGAELGERLKNHAKECGAVFKREKINQIFPEEKRVVSRKGEYCAKAIILAMGAKPKKMEAKGEAEYTGRGVSYCAVCDGGFYKDKIAAVVGGGDSAVHDCEYLSKICKRVYLIHRRTSLRKGDAALKRLNLPNVKIFFEETVAEVMGENGVVNALRLSSGRVISTDGVFVAVGTAPQSELVQGKLLTENGCIVTDDSMETSVKGVYAVGDVRLKRLRQVVTAACDGAIAAESIEF